MFPSRDAILTADDLITQDVPVPEWGPGAKVRIRGLTGAERDVFENETMGEADADGKRKRNLENFRARLIVGSALDEQGNRLFSRDDVAALTQKSAKPLDRLYNAALKLSGIGKDDVEELVKNSGAGQDAGSSSA